MKRLFTLLLIISISYTAYGQDWLVTLSGDTLRGEVQLLPSGNLPYALVKNDSGKEKVELLNIRNIYRQNIGLIKPMKVGESYKFAHLVKEGYLSLLRYSNDDRLDDFAFNVLQKLDGQTIEVPGLIGFRKTMGDFLGDCPVVAEKIEAKELGRKDIDQIVDEYNGCIQNKETFITGQQVNTQKIESSPVNTELKNLLSDFETLLKYSAQVENRTDAQQMFSDLSNKLENGQSVPNYLISGLREAVSKDEKLKELLEKILAKK